MGGDEVPEQLPEPVVAFDRAARDLNAYLDELELRVSAVEGEVDAIDRCLDDFDAQPAGRPACALLAPLARVPRVLGQTANTFVRITAQVGTFVIRVCPASVLRHERPA